MTILDSLKTHDDGKDGLLTENEVNKVTAEKFFRLKLGMFFFIYVLVSCLTIVLCVIATGKILLQRDRPTRVRNVYRLCNMRDREKGKSMPSGDSFAAVYLTAIYLWVYGNPWPLIICMPMVSIGRVFVHCHWIGDTIAGSIIGLLTSYYLFSPKYFATISIPLFRAIF